MKEAVFPFNKFPAVDPILGPEMKSTGEVMGVGDTFAEAFYKAQLGSGSRLAAKGTAFISVRDFDKGGVVVVARELADMGFDLMATRGTAATLKEAGLTVQIVNKVNQGRPHVVDMIKNREIQLVINTTEGKKAIKDSASIRRSAENNHVYYTTTLAAARALCMALRFGKQQEVRRLQDLHKRING